MKTSNLLNNYILEKYKQGKRIAIWGVGEKSVIAENILLSLSIDKYFYFDNDEKKCGKKRNGNIILSPKEISKDYFILISTVYIDEIKMQLEKVGLRHVYDWIYALEEQFYEGLFKNQDAPKVPIVTNKILNNIEKELDRIGILKKIPKYDREELAKFEKRINFEQVYKKNTNKRYKRKILEYYFVNSIFDFSNKGSDFTYLDVGSAGSPFVKWIRENTKVNAYAIDLEKGPYSDNEYYLCQDATNTNFKQSSIDAISMQSAFEMFKGESDKTVIKEFSRILKKNGKVVILPLYLHEKYISTVSPNYYKTGTSDKNSFECIRTDCWSWIPLSRFYNIDSLQERVINIARKNGLEASIFCLHDDDIEIDEFVYLKFILILTKI